MSERLRIGRELHDSTSQLLVVLQLQLIGLKRRANSEYQAALADMDATLSELHQEIRALGLDPAPPLLGRALSSALQTMCDDFQALSGVNVELHIGGSFHAMPAPIETALYRIAQEALANVWRHSEANSVRLDLRSGPAGISMTIDDDGIGIDLDRQAGSRNSGSGLANIRRRVEELGGRHVVSRLEPGTRISVEFLGEIAC